VKRREVDPAGPVAVHIIDAPLGAVAIGGTALQVRMLARHSVESFVDSPAICPVGEPGGRREHLSIHPYIAGPAHSRDGRATEGINPRHSDGPLARTTARGQQRPEPIGYGQAWYYPAVRTIVLWDLMSYHPENLTDPAQHDILPTLWLGVEEQLRSVFPDATRILTPSWEPAFHRGAWQRFLDALGYRPLDTDTYAKDV
jgi:hypothetical protein